MFDQGEREQNAVGKVEDRHGGGGRGRKRVQEIVELVGGALF